MDSSFKIRESGLEIKTCVFGISVHWSGMRLFDPKFSAVQSADPFLNYFFSLEGVRHGPGLRLPSSTGIYLFRESRWSRRRLINRRGHGPLVPAGWDWLGPRNISLQADAVPCRAVPRRAAPCRSVPPAVREYSLSFLYFQPSTSP